MLGHDHYCQHCHRTFITLHALNTHRGIAHRSIDIARKKRERSPTPPLHYDELPLEPFHRFKNELIYTAQPEPPTDDSEPEDEEDDHVGNPIAQPFNSKKELKHVRWSQKANISRRKMTEFLQMNKHDPMYSSRNMLHISAQIKRIPECHPHIATGDWIADSIGRLSPIEMSL